ncbi:hypothetical protein B5S28_g1768 [[Candida] boidinii]|nr:hypothetical protein B5S28_g1768 [[Candida] boidinii]OWB61209.1 hypothetical protein B5S29_g2096 [[Candida] boidinii]
MSKRGLEISTGVTKGNILPLTEDDIIEARNNRGSIPDDLNSIANSIPSTIGSTTLNSFANNTRSKSRLHPNKRKSRKFYSTFKIPTYFRRLFRPPTLDFETAVWEMVNLIMQPKRVYRSLYYHKQTKNTWSRDDPSFVILLSFLLVISAICWGITYTPELLSIIKLIIYMVVVDFLFTGIIIATIGWVLANKIFENKTVSVSGNSTFGNSGNSGMMSNSGFLSNWLGSNSSNNSNSIFMKISKAIVGFIITLIPNDSILEWAYCFDVHCNSYLIVWLMLYLVQYILLPLLRMNNWVSMLIGNTLYLVTASYYFVVTFYGYNSLPFLRRTELLLIPIPIFIIVWIIFNVSGFNLSAYMCDVYFN